MNGLPLLGVERALVLAPHTDDEMGCAGTMHRLLGSGAQVRYVALSRCEESVPQGFPRDVLEAECRRCLRTLGVRNEDVQVWDFAVRHFPARRQEILERLVSLSREYQPQLVLLPCRGDIHQDHATVSAEGFRAFKHASLFGYELLQNVSASETQAFVALSREDLEAKVRALGCYESQAFRAYSKPEYIESLARVRGVQCNAPFAEAFEAIRLIL